MRVYYGLTSSMDIERLVTYVVSRLDHPSSNAIKLMMETCAAETALGTAKDIHTKSGHGLFQFDSIGIDDVIERTAEDTKNEIIAQFGIDIDTVKSADLDYSPLSSALFARLKYLLVPDAIPSGIEGRGKYWKKWYNSELGSGTITHYLQSAELIESDAYHSV